MGNCLTSYNNTNNNSIVQNCLTIDQLRGIRSERLKTFFVLTEREENKDQTTEKPTRTKKKKNQCGEMELATIVIAALLGSAGVAQAGRKCVVCGPDLDIWNPPFTPPTRPPSDTRRGARARLRHSATDERRKWANCKKDLSEYMRLDVAAQKRLGISIQGRQ